jgi:hypothetical protein
LGLGIFSPELDLFFLFLSWKPSMSSEDVSADDFAVALEDDVASLPTLLL